MKLKWYIVVSLAVIATATAQDYYEDSWGSDEDPSDIFEDVDSKKEEPVDNDAMNEDFDPFNMDDIDYKEEENPIDVVETFKKAFNSVENDERLVEENHVEEDAKKYEIVGAEQEEMAPVVDDSKADGTVEDVVENDKPADDKEIDQLVQEEIKQIREELDEPESEVADNLDDYQIEDNRSDSKEEYPGAGNLDLDFRNKFEMDSSIAGINDEFQDNNQIVADAKKLLEEKNGPFEEYIADEDLSENEQREQDLVSNESKNLESHQLDLDYNDGDDTNNKDSIDDIVEVFLEFQNSNRELNEDDSQEDADINMPEQKDIVYDDTKDDALPENNFDESKEINVVKYENDMIDPNEEIARVESNSNDDNNEEQNEDQDISEQEDEDTVDKVKEDLNADLEKLFAIWNKLTSNESQEEEVVDTLARDEYEKKYGAPDKESIVLKEREDFYDTYGAIDDDILKSSMEGDSDSVVYYDDKNVLVDIKLSTVEPESKIDASNENPEILLIPKFGNLDDALEEEIKDSINYENTFRPELPFTSRSIDVEELNPEQYNDVMTQFALVHASELDPQAKDYGRNIAAIHMTLTAEEPTEITSPNFPATYPTNNVVDWILEGEGTGIELNITDLEIRGAQNDFLLIKPGGLDETGHEGLVFSYHLNEPRRYRFTDVSRVFVRFQSGTGLGFLKGFRMTVKMIWPPELPEEEELPEAELLLPNPPAIMTVNLGGISVSDFRDIEERFRRVVADMATMYINANKIETGLNSTSDTAQITNVAVCNINWPNFEECAAVSFGVPLVYEDEEMTRLDEMDLVAMWSTYVNRDPFAARLRAMGIKVFEPPNDQRVLMVWAVLAAGILLSVAVLALTLWRYSCFEDYTRMKSFGDSDSVRDEKRGLDLYPTPHQTLPPLYAENDYKWADSKYDDTTRVDLGGFTNNSYAPDELFDIDSEEEVVVKRDRNAGFSPREVYQV